MQPVIYDLEQLKLRWNQSSTFNFLRTESNLRRENHCEKRATHLVIMDVALLALSVIAISAAVSLGLNGLVTPFQGGYGITTFGKLAFGGLLGLVSVDLLKLRFIVDRCRSIFTEFQYASKNKQVDDRKRQRWNEELERVKKDYKDLYVVDSALDILYPAVATE